MSNSIKKIDGKWVINGKELPTHINGEKILGVQMIEKNGKQFPIIELEDTKHPPITTVKGKPTIKIRFKNEGGGKNLERCIIERFRFERDKWYTVDKDTYLNDLFMIADNEFDIDINGEIIPITQKNKDYITKKLS